MSEPPLTVGVVVPVHGWTPYLAEALDGVLGAAPARVVVVDDGSPDPVELHPDHAAGVELVRREVRGGPAAARNTAISALGEDVELVAFCDADDAWEPGSLAARVAALRETPDAALAFGRALIVGPDGRPTGERWADVPAGPYASLRALYRHNPILTSSVVVRRTALGSGFDERYPLASDWELWLRLLRDGARFVSAPRGVVRYRRHPGGLTSRVLDVARAQTALHDAYGASVPDSLRAEVRATDRRAEAAGLVRTGEHASARRLLEPGARRALLAVPGLRGLMGRRDPYVRRR